MLSTHRDITLSFIVKDGNRTVSIEGASDDLMAAAAFMACRVCALRGKTPGAAEEARRLLVDTINAVGPGAVRDMFYEESRKTSSAQKEPASTPPHEPEKGAPMIEDCPSTQQKRRPCFTCRECHDMGCQCERCENNTSTCCFAHQIRCPNSDNYDPGYVCPDFTPKKEEHSDATE